MFGSAAEFDIAMHSNIMTTSLASESVDQMWLFSLKIFLSPNKRSDFIFAMYLSANID